MSVIPISRFGAPFDDSPDEIESREELMHHLEHGTLRNLTIQGLRLDEDPPDLSTVDVDGSLFIGCRFAGSDIVADLIRRGADIIPAFAAVPYPTQPPGLYTPDDLAEGYGDRGFDGMFDTVVDQHFLSHNGALPDMREAMSQRLHDHGIDDALDEVLQSWIAQNGADYAVGIMGGHAALRGSEGYRMAAELAWRLARADRLVVTGGGPGVMEAANLGAFLADRSESELAAAIDELAQASDFRDHDAYTSVALKVRAQYAEPGPWHRRGGLSIPTWLYGHEPANLFAGRIAKYFSNAIREDTILRLARGGIVFAEGRAGTVQEIFQAATKTFYNTDGKSGPYVFLGKRFWTEDLNAPDLLRTLLTTTREGDLSHLVHLADDPVTAAAILLA